jgi:NAD(P)-dependent dehydrogenase (short-subunit alcohol dehydrogenase family)
MPAKLKPLSQQVVVITGASAGTGLALARRAARGGAAVVLGARDEALLREICERIVAAGGRAHAVAGDLSDPEDAARLARAAVARFGGLDTWINDAGELPGDDEIRRRATYLAAVNATLEAVSRFRTQDGGGTIVNITAPGATAAALKGFGDALRAELRRERAPVRLTLAEAGDGRSPDVAAADILRRVAHGSASRERAGSPTLKVAVGVGALAAAGAAAWLGRGLLMRAARPLLAGAVRPILMRAALRRPAAAAGLAIRHPKAAVKGATRLLRAAS